MCKSFYQYLEDEAHAELADEADEKHIACVNATVTAERLRLIGMEETLRHIRDFKFDKTWSASKLWYWITFLQEEAAKELRFLLPESEQ